MAIYEMMLAPIITAILCLVIPNRRMVEMISAIGAAVSFTQILMFSTIVFKNGPIIENIWYIDSLSMYILIIIGLISLLAALYSISYIGHEYEEKVIDLKKLQLYYVLFHLFLDTMILVCITNNLGIMWIGIEATTLASAFLVNFYNNKTSIEAAWKYVIICSAGITLAFLGFLFTYQAAIIASINPTDAMNWTILNQNKTILDANLLKLAFIFIFIGFGTKVGLAPMHTWLPDAHSQAPTPISALLSGVLLNVALYGILRYHVIVKAVLGSYSENLFLIFGFISLIIATAFIIISKDYKRLLAYHSIEHMGIISIGLGIGGPIGVFGAIFHIFNHALTKSYLFFAAGNILTKYKTRNMEEIKGVITVMPWTGALFMIGMLALTGNPPFSIFASELTIINAMFIKNNFVAAIVFILALVMIFAGFVSHATSMIFGKAERSEHTEHIKNGEVSKINVAILIVLLIIITYIGIIIPPWFNAILTNITNMF